jgi:hypothetical protein
LIFCFLFHFEFQYVQILQIKNRKKKTAVIDELKTKHNPFIKTDSYIYIFSSSSQTSTSLDEFSKQKTIFSDSISNLFLLKNTEYHSLLNKRLSEQGTFDFSISKHLFFDYLNQLRKKLNHAYNSSPPIVLTNQKEKIPQSLQDQPHLIALFFIKQIMEHANCFHQVEWKNEFFPNWEESSFFHFVVQPKHAGVFMNNYFVEFRILDSKKENNIPQHACMRVEGKNTFLYKLQHYSGSSLEAIAQELPTTTRFSENQISLPVDYFLTTKINEYIIPDLLAYEKNRKKKDKKQKNTWREQICTYLEQNKKSVNYANVKNVEIQKYKFVLLIYTKAPPHINQILENKIIQTTNYCNPPNESLTLCNFVTPNKMINLSLSERKFVFKFISKKQVQIYEEDYDVVSWETTTKCSFRKNNTLCSLEFDRIDQCFIFNENSKIIRKFRTTRAENKFEEKEKKKKKRLAKKRKSNSSPKRQKKKRKNTP